MSEDLKLTPSMEDYLEVIAQLEKEKKVARVREIANALKVKMPSVSGALKVLREKELIHYEKNSFITLTELGKSIADSIIKRHQTISAFLESVLLLPHEKATEMGCKIEHFFDMETTYRLERLVKSFQNRMMGPEGMPPEAWGKIISPPQDDGEW